MSANVYDTLSEKQRKELQEVLDAFKEGAFDIHTYTRSFEPTDELPIGIYDIPKDCRAVVLEGGRKVEIRKKKNLPLEPTEHRCCHCKHYVEGYTGLYHWSTMVCDAKPKALSKAMEKRKAESKWYKDYTLYYAAQRYGKPCEMFELKEEEK